MNFCCTGCRAITIIHSQFQLQQDQSLRIEAVLSQISTQTGHRAFIVLRALFVDLQIFKGSPENVDIFPLCSIEEDIHFTRCKHGEKELFRIWGWGRGIGLLQKHSPYLFFSLCRAGIDQKPLFSFRNIIGMHGYMASRTQDEDMQSMIPILIGYTGDTVQFEERGSGHTPAAFTPLAGSFFEHPGTLYRNRSFEPTAGIHHANG